jgi:hypothetical protein
MGIDIYENCVKTTTQHGGKLLYGGKRLERKGFFVEPTLIAADKSAEFLKD